VLRCVDRRCAYAGVGGGCPRRREHAPVLGRVLGSSSQAQRVLPLAVRWEALPRLHWSASADHGPRLPSCRRGTKFGLRGVMLNISMTELAAAGVSWRTIKRAETAGNELPQIHVATAEDPTAL